MLLPAVALCLAGSADLEACRWLDRALSGPLLALFRAVALAVWPVKIAALPALLGLARRLCPLDRPDRRRGTYGAACLLGLLASVLVLIGRGLA